jgi:hypothetical protein
MALACGGKWTEQTNVDAGASAGAGSGGSNSVSSTIVVSQIPVGLNGVGAPPYFSVRASSQQSLAQHDGSDCMTTPSDGCTVTVCQSVGGPAKSLSFLDDGTLHVAVNGAEQVAVPYRHGPGATGYSITSGTTVLFVGRDRIALHSDGGADLPAFQDVSVIAPDAITLTAPACSPGQSQGCPPILPAHGLPIAWSGGGVGQVLASIYAAGSEQTVAIACAFAPTLRAATLPTDALSEGSPSWTQITLSIESLSEQVFQLGQAQVTFDVEQLALVSSTSVGR